MNVNVNVILPLFLLACPIGSPKEEPLPAKDDSTQSAEDTTEKPAEKPEIDVSIFGIKAKTADYVTGEDGTGVLTLGGVNEKVVSPDGTNTVEMMKIIESNLFPIKHPMPKGEGPSKVTPAEGVHAWLMWGDKQTEVALSNPMYSAGAQTLTLDAQIVDGSLEDGSFGAVELKLQDCPDTTYVCAKSTLTACNKEIGPIGTCWNWLALNCLPCHCDADMKECVEKNPTCCGHKDEPCYPSRLGPHGWERYCL